jgi:DNA-binding HxlR family transcriptional regulator
MENGYGQFCPVALASETLAQRWMPLIVRELCAGATRFSEIRRGVPGIRPTLLKQRLDTLERAGILTRSIAGGRSLYRLTVAGEELRPVLAAIGSWGQRWARDMCNEDLDPGWLVWAMHRRLNVAAMPRGRTVIEIVFEGAPAHHRHFWLIHSAGVVDVCLKSPGFETDLLVVTRVRVLAEVWRGLRPLPEAIRTGDIHLTGHSALRRDFPKWLLLSAYAHITRARQAVASP